ncbi:MAG: hypothetical protein ACRD7E_22040, partial [Bryobacteraceae bacterium]
MVKCPVLRSGLHHDRLFGTGGLSLYSTEGVAMAEDNNPQNDQRGLFMGFAVALGCAFGAGMGVAIGAVLGGVGLGLVIGSSISTA